MTWAPQNPKDALSKLDLQAMGPDAARHELLGCVVAQNGSPPGEQARNYLRSLLGAGQMTEDEFKHWWKKLVEWEAAGNVVKMPPPASDAQHPKLPPSEPQNPTQAEREETAKRLADMKAKQQAASDAVELSHNPAAFLDGVKSQEAAGLRPAGSYDGFVARVWKQAPAIARALNLPQVH